MERYIKEIEAEAAIKDLFPDMPRIEFNGNRRRWREENEQYLRCFDALRSLPTADVVEVVRCEECKWYKPSKFERKRKMCWRKDVEGMPVCYDFSPTDFCSYGERREDE